MSDINSKDAIKENRRLRLKLFFEGKPLPSDEKSLITQLMSGTHSFGEKLARRMEASYEMGGGYLDAPFEGDGSEKPAQGE